MTNALQRIFGHNAGLKLLSLLLAIIMWAAVVRSPNAEVEFRVPIELQNFPENLVLDSTSIAEAQVRIRGPEREIHQLQASAVRAEINLATVVPGQRTFDLADRVHLPPGLEVVQIIPGQLQLSFDQRATRRIEVRPQIIGSFAAGMRVAQVTSNPSTVTIMGPRNRVEAIEAALTDPVDASRVTKEGVFPTHAYVTDPLIQVAHPSLIQVTVIMEGPGGNASDNALDKKK